MLVSPEHSSNAAYPMLVTVLGMLIFVDPEQPWKSTHIFEGCTAELLQKPLIIKGEPACEDEDMQTIRARVQEQLSSSVWPEEQRFENPHKHYLDMTPAYYNMKMELLRNEDK